MVRSRFERPASVAADCDLRDLVPLRVEAAGDGTRRGQGDVVLARPAAREDGHAEAPGRAHPVVVVVDVVGGPGENWPTSIVTVEPLVAEVPPSGFCDWTMPS